MSDIQLFHEHHPLQRVWRTFFDQTPHVLQDDDSRYVLEEQHFPGWLIVVVGLLIPVPFLIGALPMMKDENSIAIFVAMVLFVFELPFWLVVFFSRYHRLEIDFDSRTLTVVKVYRVWGERSETFDWESISRLRVHRMFRRKQIDALQVFVHMPDGRKIRAVFGWWYEPLVKQLRDRTIGRMPVDFPDGLGD